MSKRRKSNSSSLLYSQAEFAYILLFIALGALSLLFLQYRAIAEELAFVYERLEEMEEKKNVRTPCWIRPDGVIPKIAGKITIVDMENIVFERTLGGRSEIVLDKGFGVDPIRSAIVQLFLEDRQFAERNFCYLRLSVVNNTGSYDVYLAVDQLLRGMGIVSIPE